MESETTFDQLDSVKNLRVLYEEKMGATHLRTLLQDDARNEPLIVEAEGVTLDYTHTKIDSELLR